MVSDNVVLSKIEEGIMLQQSVLKMIALDRVNLYIGCNSAATVNRAATIGQLDFFVGGIANAVAVEVVVIERDVAVITLNQPTAGGVIFRRRQGQTGVVRERINRLNQAFAKRGFADY